MCGSSTTTSPPKGRWENGGDYPFGSRHGKARENHGRTNKGRAEAKAKGVKFGRKRSINRKELLRLIERIGTAEIARQMNIGRSTVYKILKEESRLLGSNGTEFYSLG